MTLSPMPLFAYAALICPPLNRKTFADHLALMLCEALSGQQSLIRMSGDKL